MDLTEATVRTELCCLTADAASSLPLPLSAPRPGDLAPQPSTVCAQPCPADPSPLARTHTHCEAREHLASEHDRQNTTVESPDRDHQTHRKSLLYPLAVASPPYVYWGQRSGEKFRAVWADVPVGATLSCQHTTQHIGIKIWRQSFFVRTPWCGGCRPTGDGGGQTDVLCFALRWGSRVREDEILPTLSVRQR